MERNSALILGVDGGGTKTVACVARISPTSYDILGRGQAGTSNLAAVGKEAALANLGSAIELAWQAAGVAPQEVPIAVLGLSGAGRPATQEIVAAWMQGQHLASRIQVVHDALPVLVAGTPQGVGVALIAGTGAVAYAVNQSGESAVSGGWGYWFGDEGSAFWLGQAAARAAASSADGRTESTQLLPAILERLGISEPREILAALSRSGDVRSALAGLADLVAPCAAAGDAVAMEIVTRAGEELAELVMAASRRVELDPQFSLALAGGVLAGSRAIQDALLAELEQLGIQPAATQLVLDPVLGCLEIARKQLHAGE